MSFVASVTVNELLMKSLENVALDLASRCVMELSKRHGLNGEEEIRMLGLESLSVIRKKMAKKCGSEKKVKLETTKSVFPMPFSAEGIKVDGCKGLSYNRGLFTQCQKKRMENGQYCKSCQTEADNNASGCPNCGTVEQRLASGLYEFKDQKNRSPTSYVKVLNKLKLNVDAAWEELGKTGIKIPEEHFAAPAEKVKKTTGVRGRPKKVGKIEVETVTDLFAKLTTEGEAESVETKAAADVKKTMLTAEEKFAKMSVEGEEESVETKAAAAADVKKTKLSDEEKAAKREAMETERQQKREQLEAKRNAEKAEREAKRNAEKAEREVKRNAEKAEREVKRSAEKAEREQKKQEKEAAKASASKKPTVSEKSAVVKAKVPPVPASVIHVLDLNQEEPEKIRVTRIQFGGKTYFMSNTNILYDIISKEEVGLWDPDTQTIKDLPEEEDDEVEEEDDEVEEEDDEVEEEDYETDN